MRQRSTEPTNYTYHHDTLQSVVGLSGHAGTVEETLRYEPFGELLSSTGSGPSTLRFTGREFDAETGLYYYRARYYDPEIGRFPYGAKTRPARLRSPPVIVVQHPAQSFMPFDTAAHVGGSTVQPKIPVQPLCSGCHPTIRPPPALDLSRVQRTRRTFPLLRRTSFWTG